METHADSLAQRALRIAAPIVGQILDCDADRCAMVLAHRCLADAHALRTNHIFEVRASDLFTWLLLSAAGPADVQAAFERKARALVRFKPRVADIHVFFEEAAVEHRDVLRAAVSGLRSHAPRATLTLHLHHARSLTSCGNALINGAFDERVCVQVWGVANKHDVHELVGLIGALAVLRELSPRDRGHEPFLGNVSLDLAPGLSAHEVAEALGNAAPRLGDHVAALHVMRYEEDDWSGAGLSQAALASLATVPTLSLHLRWPLSNVQDGADDRLIHVATHVHDHVGYGVEEYAASHMEAYATCRRLERVYVHVAAAGQMATAYSAAGAANLVHCMYASEGRHPEFSVAFCERAVEDPGIVALAAAVLRRVARLPETLRRQKTVSFTYKTDGTSPAQALCTRLAFLQVDAIARREGLARPLCLYRDVVDHAYFVRPPPAHDKSYDRALAELADAAPHLHDAWALLALPPPTPQ
jgi:hypothetical protein